MANSKVIKTIVKRKKRQVGRRLTGIKQGVGAVTTRAFPRPSQAKRRPKAGGNGLRHAFNALSPCHLPLPRAVGGYTTIRTTDIVNTSRECLLFGTFKGPGSEFTDTVWYNTICAHNNATTGSADLPIGDAAIPGSAYFHTSEALGAVALNGSRMVPAAITVQVMNGESLQTADGIVYIGRSKTVLDLMGETRTWNTVLKQLVSYSAPRLCSAGKLALRGVQINAIPNNLSVLSDFVPRRISPEGPAPWTEAAQGGIAQDFEGFGPIFVYNPDKVPLKYLVTIEWRMRFDPINPAYAGHINHIPASEATWSKTIAAEESMGNGVRDIVEDVAEMGMVAAMMG